MIQLRTICWHIKAITTTWKLFAYKQKKKKKT